MEKSILEKSLLLKIKEFIDENEIIVEKEIDLNTRLIGSSSIFDSIELVTFIVDVEQYLDEKFDKQIQLASERAMSRRTSPFISIRTLTDYICEIVNE